MYHHYRTNPEDILHILKFRQVHQHHKNGRQDMWRILIDLQPIDNVHFDMRKIVFYHNTFHLDTNILSDLLLFVPQLRMRTHSHIRIGNQE